MITPKNSVRIRRYLNLGCGQRAHPGWTNVDFRATTNGVLEHDLGTGIPFGDGSFDVVYCSHVLEHFRRPAASAFLRECWRVLRHGGVLRVVVPDLEQIAREYLGALERAARGAVNGPLDHEWMVLELFDQAVRETPGGEMAQFLRNQKGNEDFVIGRCGSAASSLMEMSNSRVGRHARQLRRALSLRETFYRILLGSDYEALQVGRFRRSGEVHQWMYDRFSLERLLIEAGFKGVTRRSAVDSYIDDWVEFHLDTEADGTIYKPDSLYFEGLKKGS
jgi:predicted SAM-dependent methyltransferase